MAKIVVPYGRGFQEAVVDEDINIDFIDFKKEENLEDEVFMLKKALNNPIGSKRLEDMVDKEDKVLIVVNDHTRPGPNKIIVKEITERLEAGGISKEQVKFIVATGSHRATTKEELNNIFGQEIVENYEFIIHDCRDDENLVYVGDSKYDVPIYVNKILTESTFCIVTGLISPHHSAGYSGGRKSIVPGLAGFETLKIHHSLPIRPFEPAMGFIYGNPFHEIALEIALKLNTKFMVNVVQNPEKQNIAFVAGDIVEAHSKGVEICKTLSEVEVEEKADIVIVTPGGHPRDRNLYQAQKALSVAEMIGKPDCVFILVTESKDGYGEGVLREWLEIARDPKDVIERFKEEGYDVGSNKAFMFARAMLKGDIIVVSEYLDEKVLKDMMMDWAPNLQIAVDKAMQKKKANKIIVLPNAVNIIPKIVK